jgi:hypothetical protein
VLRSVRYAARLQPNAAVDRGQRLKYNYASAGSGGASVDASGSTIDLITNLPTYNNNTPGGPNLDVNLDPVAMADSSDIPPLENFGYLQLEVQGRVLRPGSNTDTLATATVVKEYQVIPKCCNRSFSGPSTSITGSPGTPLFSFGNDQRACGGTADLGLLFGFNGGALTVNGTASSVQELNFNATGTQLANTSLQSALCITTSPTTSNCVSPTSTNPIPVAGGSTVPVIPIIFDVDVGPQPRNGPTIDPTIGATIATAGSINDIEPSNPGYFRVNPLDTNQMQRCHPTLASDGSIDPGTCSVVPFCRRVTGSTVADFHCKMNKIVILDDIVYFDTSRASIALFFNDSSDSDSGTVDLQGSSRLLHRYCGPQSIPPVAPPDETSGCNTEAAPAQFTRLSFFGNQALNRFNFQGGPEGTAMFIYFRRGNVLISADATASGSIWTNNLTLNNSFSFTSAAPAANCATASSGFCHILRGSLGAGQGGGSAALFDWVARSPVTTRVY